MHDFLRHVNAALRRIAREAAIELRRTKRVIVHPEARPIVEEPIFIIGVHRSGTTLLRLILDSHSRIACPPESFFLLPPRRLLDDQKGMTGLSAMGFDRQHVLRQMRELSSYFFEVYAAARTKPRWADKTPPYVDCLDFIDELFEGRCKYLMIYRHGLDSACSIVGTPIPEVEEYVAACGGDRHAGAACYWAVQCEKMLAFRESHASRCFEVRYEELTTRPETCLPPLFEFLDEAWEPAVLRFHEHQHDHWIGLQDIKAAESKGFMPNIGAYKRQPAATVARMAERAAPILDRLGYGV